VAPNNGQWLITVVSENKKEILIPFHEHFIVRIDKGNNSVIMNIPEGLKDIN
jgi:ribosomal 30S subunit maturation factor RimM